MVKTRKPRKSKSPENTNVFRGSASVLGDLRSLQVPEAGVTQTEFDQGNKAVSETSGPASGPNCRSGRELQRRAVESLANAIVSLETWQHVANLPDMSDVIREVRTALIELQKNC